MTRAEWTNLRRLLAAWPTRRDHEFDHEVYVHVLGRFPADQVRDALTELAATGAAGPPTAREIVRQIQAMFEQPAPDAGLIEARRLAMDAADRAECERRDRELEEWAREHPEQVAVGEALARRLGLTTEGDDTHGRVRR